MAVAALTQTAMCRAFIAAVLISLPLLGQSPKPCQNVNNTATAGQVLSASIAGNTPPCTWVNGTVHGIGATFDGAGSALTVGTKTYITVPYGCTIRAWNMTVDTGTATIDVWKIATGAAIPTVVNTITAAALPAIASGTALHSTTLTAWTTTVTANDIFGFNVSAVSGATKASLVLQCQ